MSYIVKDYLKDGAAQSCTASATAAISNTIPLSVRDSEHFLAKVECSAMVTATGITFKLQESLDGSTWEDAGSESQPTSTKKTFAGGVAEITDTTWPSTAGATQADYLHVTAQDGTKYAIWLDIDAAGTAPSGALYVAADQKIKVSIVTGGTAAANAALARTAVLANAAWVTDFTVSTVSTATFTTTQINGGIVADHAPKSANDGGAGSVTVSVTTAGTDGGVALSNEQLTSTSHGWLTGDPVIYVAGTVGVTGLTTGTTYYVIKVDANTLKLATTQVLAFAGTAIDVTAPGTGTQSLYAQRYEIRLLIEDSTDNAQLPLWPLCRVVAVTGSGDTCTVSHVNVTRRV